MNTVPPLVDITAVLVGGLTGSLLAVRKQFDLVGVGILRDVLAGEAPALFRTGELYAMVSGLGSALFVALWESTLVSRTVAGVAAISVMFVLRLLAVRFGWTAPKALA